jgi:integrase
MHCRRRKERAERPQVKSSRFTPDLDGFERYREASKPLAETSKAKWLPIIRRIEKLREEVLEGKAWSEIDPEEIAYELMAVVYGEVRGRGAGEPASNTLRGRYDAAYAYFDFLLLIGALADDRHPLDFLARPSSVPNVRPFLEEDEDWRLAQVELEGHEQAVYTLSRSNLREDEICQLEDEDVDLENGVITIRDGKTKTAIRRIPLYPEAVRRLSGYRRWRDENVHLDSKKFVRTRSGGISAGYIWKLVKAIGVRAEIRLIEIPSSDPGREPQNSTELTPHALRRTWGADLVRRDVPTTVFSATYGHASKRVSEESYTLVSDETATRKILLAGGGGPFSMSGGIDGLEREIVVLQGASALDRASALARLEDVRLAAEAAIRTIASAST